MNKEEKRNIGMTNKEMMQDVLNEIIKMGYKVKDVMFTDTYFLFDGDKDSICEFEIKEIQGFKFALWSVSRFDTIEYQIENCGIGHTWANSLKIDPRSDVVFFAQYKRDLDKFKPSRSGFVWGLYRDSWQEENNKGEIIKVEEWRELGELASILRYMKRHRFKAIEHCGRQSRYIWEDDINGFVAYWHFISDWLYEYKSRFKEWIKNKRLIIKSKRLLRKIKMSYSVLIENEKGCFPRLQILLRRKPEIDTERYIKEQQLIDKFENKHYMSLSLVQFDIDITLPNLTEENMTKDKEEREKFFEIVKNEEEDNARRILYSNIKQKGWLQ